MQNNTIHKQNRVYAPIIIGLSLFAITFLLYPLYVEYVDTNTQVVALEKSKAEKQKKIGEVVAMQQLFSWTGMTEVKSKVQKYNHPFDTSNLMEAVMVNKFTKASALSPAQISIGGITVDKWRKLPSGLSLGTVSVSVSAETPDQIIDYITYLATESSYAFTIDSIVLPLDTAMAAQDNKWLSLSLSLGVYYYE
jgi:hypothetical protein